MKTRREFLTTTLGGMAGGLLAGQIGWGDDKSAKTPDMVDAARRMLQAMSAEQRAQTLYPLNDAERFNWHFVPLNDREKRVSTRKGIMLEEMSAPGQAAAMDLLKTCTSPDAYTWSQQIMERENIIGELEPNNIWFRRPGWYFYTVYGEPSDKGSWGWRIDGHHLTISVAIVDGRIVSATPYFMGVNPVTIKYGPRNGERETITPCEDLGRELFLSLDAGQKRITLLEDPLREVPGKTLKAPSDLPARLPAADMTTKQHDKLVELIDHYLNRMPQSLAEVERTKLHKAGLEKVKFTYTGVMEAAMGKQHTYAVQGPTFQIHYLNQQTDPQRNPSNHIHSIYRSLDNDFGGATPA